MVILETAPLPRKQNGGDVAAGAVKPIAKVSKATPMPPGAPYSFHLEWRRMRRLVKPNLPATRQLDRSSDAPAFALRLRAAHAFFLQFCDLLFEVITHEVKHSTKHRVTRMHILYKVRWYAFARMHRQFRRWQRKDQPSAAGIYGTKPEHLFEELAISVSIRAVKQNMGTSDHGANCNLLCLHGLLPAPKKEGERDVPEPSRPPATLSRE